MPDKFRKKKSNFATTLVTGIGTGTGDTITLNSTSGLPTDTEITLTFNRVTSAGAVNPTSLVERIKGTISGSTFTSYTRGVDNTTEQGHVGGTVVEYIPNAADENDLVDGILVEHNQDGTHKSALVTTLKATGAEVTTGTEDAKIVTPKAIKDATLTLTSPKVVTAITDANGNEVIKTPATADAVNEFTITNAATGNAPELSVTGGDTDIDLKLSAKGAGEILLDAHYQTPQTYTPSGAGTTTLDLSTGNTHIVTMPAATQTLAISNAKVGQYFIVQINNVTSQGALTWFSTIRWAGGSAPTLTGTNGKRDVFGFYVSGSGTYDGFVVGQNL